MNYTIKSLLIILTTFFVALTTSQLAHAQTASFSAITPTLAALPTLFPSPSSVASSTPTFQILQQLNVKATSSSEIASPSVTLSPTASISATSDYCLNVPIIMYHHVEPLEIATLLGHPQLTEDYSYFEEHIKYLVDHHYHLISLEDLVHAILDRTTVPDKSVVITLDDGYIDNYTYAFLVAKKYHALMNFNIPTGLVGKPDYVTWDHLKEMAQSPYVRLYNHTTTHAPLGLIDQDQIVTEVTTANRALKDNLGITNNIVVYPYGSYSDLAIDTLKQLGIIAALSTDPGTDECLSNIYKLPRVRVGNEPIENYGY